VGALEVVQAVVASRLTQAEARDFEALGRQIKQLCRAIGRQGQGLDRSGVGTEQSANREASEPV